MKQDNTPIALSGRVFVDKLLAHEHPGLSLPDGKLRRGDVKLIAVPKSGHKHRQGCCPSFAGFLAAYVFDGKGWRKLALREGAACEATYVDRPSRRSRLHGVVDVLRKLPGREALWSERTFTVPYRQPAAAAQVPTVTAPSVPTSGLPAPGSTSGAAAQGKPSPGTTVTHVAPETPTEDGRLAAERVAPARKRRRNEPDPNQLLLF